MNSFKEGSQEKYCTFFKSNSNPLLTEKTIISVHTNIGLDPDHENLDSDPTSKTLAYGTSRNILDLVNEHVKEHSTVRFVMKVPIQFTKGFSLQKSRSKLIKKGLLYPYLLSIL